MDNEMKQFIAFVIKETKHILRDKRTMLILFGMPVVMMLLFGFAITTDVKNVRTVVVTSEMSPRPVRSRSLNDWHNQNTSLSRRL